MMKISKHIWKNAVARKSNGNLPGNPGITLPAISLIRPGRYTVIRRWKPYKADESFEKAGRKSIAGKMIKPIHFCSKGMKIFVHRGLVVSGKTLIASIRGLRSNLKISSTVPAT